MAKQLDVVPRHLGLRLAGPHWEAVPGTLENGTGVRPATDDDFTAVESWLREHVVPWDHNLRHLQDAVLEWYRSRHIEPPTEGRMERLVRSAVRMHEDEICDGTAAKLLPSTRKALDALIDSSLPSDEHDAQEGADWRSTSFSVLKTIRDVVSRVLRELEKLRQIETLELPANLFAAIQPKILRQYRLRAGEPPVRCGDTLSRFGTRCWQPSVGSGDKRSSMVWWTC